MTSVRKGQRSHSRLFREPTDEASTKHQQLPGSISKMYIASPYPGIRNRNFLDWAPYSQISKYLFSEFFPEPFLKTSASAVRFQSIDKCNKYSSFALSVSPPPLPQFQVTRESRSLWEYVQQGPTQAHCALSPVQPYPGGKLPSVLFRADTLLSFTQRCSVQKKPAELLGMDSSPNTEQNFYNLYVSRGWMEKANS